MFDYSFERIKKEIFTSEQTSPSLSLTKRDESEGKHVTLHEVLFSLLTSLDFELNMVKAETINQRIIDVIQKPLEMLMPVLSNIRNHAYAAKPRYKIVFAIL